MLGTWGIETNKADIWPKREESLLGKKWDCVILLELNKLKAKVCVV